MTLPTGNLSIVLSREELAFLLFTLKADFIPGLDPDPLGELTPDQTNLSLLFAERALRARDLVSLDEKGSLVVRETLMLMVATCAYSELMLSLHHFPSNAAPSRAFWHVRSGVIVEHTRPEAPLHRFDFLKDRAALEEKVLESCHLAGNESAVLPEVITSNAVLKKVRETAVKDVNSAIEILVQDGVTQASAREICALLAGEHSVSALHFAARKADATTHQESATVLAGLSSTWLMTASEGDQVVLKPVGVPTLRGLLQGWLDTIAPWPEIPVL